MPPPVSEGSHWLIVLETPSVLHQCDHCHPMRAEGFRCTRSKVPIELGRWICRVCFNMGGLRREEAEPPPVS